MRRMCKAGAVLFAVLAAATAQAGETRSISGIRVTVGERMHRLDAGGGQHTFGCDGVELQ